MIFVLIKWISKKLLSFIFKTRTKPIHILFCMVDHYEPGTGHVTDEIANNRVARLLLEYPRIAENHRDSAGNYCKRTWFFPPHYHKNYFLRDLVTLCEKGYGEIELHLHHGKDVPDTSANLEKTILQCIEEYSLFGIFGSENNVKKYAFIHGDWALDNSRYDQFCGVNNEIEILRKTGCFADFTFPSGNESNPSQINSIYYSTDDPIRPKSYTRGTPVRASSEPYGDLMIIQGPLYPFFIDNKLRGLRIFGDKIDGKPPVTKKRIDAWINTGICIEGKGEWIIVKTHTHGAIDSDAVLGNEMDVILDYLEDRYNDGKNYVLHYLTARELYNIIKAVEDGQPGSDPEVYRDYIIKAPQYTSSPEISGASEKLKALIARTYSG